MQRVSIGEGHTISRLVYGMMRIKDAPDRSAAGLCAKLQAALEVGITTVDHADIYGGYSHEEFFGAAIRGTGLRDQIEIVTKCGIIYPGGPYGDVAMKHYDTTGAHIRASVDRSLRLLGTDRIDLFLIHRPDPLMDHHDAGAALDAVVRAGKVRAVGVSNFRPWDVGALQAAMQNRLAVNQIELSLAAVAAFGNGDIPHLQERGMVPMAWSPIAGARLMASADDPTPLERILDRIATAQGVGRAAVAVAWLLAHPSGIVPVLGSNQIDRIRAWPDALRVKISRVDWFDLYTAAIGHGVP